MEYQELILDMLNRIVKLEKEVELLKKDKNPSEIMGVLYGGLGAILDVIDQQPTIEPVRHGRWVYTGEWTLPECSVCRKVAHSALYGDEDAYCPCCGAKMCGDKNESNRC